MPKIKSPEFNRQIKSTNSVESLGGWADYLYFQHETPREGALPVLVASGWSEGTQILRDTAQEIFDDGREVIVIDHARRGGIKASQTDFHREITHKATTLLNILDDAGLEKVDVIAHSEGALNTVLAASWQPERFRNIILVAPAGMIGGDTVPKLVGRFASKLRYDLEKGIPELKARDPKKAKQYKVSPLKYFIANPTKAFREVGAIAHTQIDRQLSDLREAGIQIGILQSHSDRGFPDERIYQQIVLQEAVNGPNPQDLQMSVDGYASVAASDAGHDDIIIHPERTTRAALDMLAGFEKL